MTTVPAGIRLNDVCSVCKAYVIAARAVCTLAHLGVPPSLTSSLPHIFFFPHFFSFFFQFYRKGSPSENNAVIRCNGKGCDVCIHQGTHLLPLATGIAYALYAKDRCKYNGYLLFQPRHYIYFTFYFTFISSGSECYGVVTLPQHTWYCKRCEPHSTVRATKVVSLMKQSLFVLFILISSSVVVLPSVSILPVAVC